MIWADVCSLHLISRETGKIKNQYLVLLQIFLRVLTISPSYTMYDMWRGGGGGGLRFFLFTLVLNINFVLSICVCVCGGGEEGDVQCIQPVSCINQAYISINSSVDVQQKLFVEETFTSA